MVTNIVVRKLRAILRSRAQRCMRLLIKFASYVVVDYELLKVLCLPLLPVS